MECRGLVVDSDYNVIIKPFTKVFNHHENGTNIDRDELCTVVRKVNGFMGAATYNRAVSKDIIYSTTGSLDSDFAVMVEKHVKRLEPELKEYEGTYIFEICDPSDPHIVYEEPGPYLIGFIDQGRQMDEYYLNLMGEDIGCRRPETYFNRAFSQVVKMAKECKHEGYMVYGNDSGTALKIKSPYYLVTKFLARAGEAKLVDLLMKNDRQAFRQRFDEEYYPLIDELIKHKDEFIGYDEQHRIGIIQHFLEKM